MTTTAAPPPAYRGSLRRLPAVLAVVSFTTAALTVIVEVLLVFFFAEPALWILPPLVSGLGVALGFRLPWVSLILVSAAPFISVAVGSEPTGIWSITVFLALFLALRNRHGLLIALVTAGANVAALGILFGGVSFDQPIPMVAAGAALLATATGAAIRNQTAYRHELEGRAREAEAGRAAAVRRGIAEERLKIARDLHDSIGHHVAVVNMHLGAAEVLVRTLPDQASEQLALARSGVQGVLQETQEILRVLRMHDDPDASRPTADHAEIGALVERFEQAGLHVEAEIVGLDVPLDPLTSIAIYRITQESLTNAQRYGAGGLTLAVRIDEKTAQLEARNIRSRTRATSGGGNGLVGMRERAESVGGHLEAGTEGDDFVVRASLPARRASRG